MKYKCNTNPEINNENIKLKDTEINNENIKL